MKKLAPPKFLICSYSLFILLIINLSGISQNVAVNATGAAPNVSAGLDVDFTNKGMLIPRVALISTASSAPLAAHVAGMIVYNTATAGDVTPGFYSNNGSRWLSANPSGNAVGDMLYWNGTSWVVIPAGLPNQFLGSNGTSPVWVTPARVGTPSALTTNEPSATTGNSVSIGGNITDDGGADIIVRGICYSTTSNPTTANSIVAAVPATGTGAFTCNLTGLAPVTTYYARAYASNNLVTSYGNEVSFTTLPLPPTLTTDAVDYISGNSATSGGSISDNGGAPVLERGICWSISSKPTIVYHKTSDGTGTGPFTSSITGLLLGTKFYVRAYATNSAGTGYGNEQIFSTASLSIGDDYQGGKIAYILSEADQDYVEGLTQGLIAATSDQSTSAQWGCYGTSISGANGGIIGDGRQNTIDIITGCSESGIAARICSDLVFGGYDDWFLPSYEELKQLYENRVAIGGLSGSNYWSSTVAYGNYAYAITNSTGSITSCKKNLNYSVRAVRAFSISVKLTTTDADPSSITSETATCGGDITKDGGEPITARGVCWSTDSGPTIDNHFTVDGTGKGTFTSLITGLASGTTYYVRAYATNIWGTWYGPEISFSTP